MTEISQKTRSLPDELIIIDTIEKRRLLIDYVAQLVGPQHVGLGLDYVIEDKAQMLDFFTLINGIYGDEQYPLLDGYSFTSPAQVPQITDELLILGYGDEDVINILGGNWMRVFRQVWG